MGQILQKGVFQFLYLFGDRFSRVNENRVGEFDIMERARRYRTSQATVDQMESRVGIQIQSLFLYDMNLIVGIPGPNACLPFGCYTAFPFFGLWVVADVIGKLSPGSIAVPRLEAVQIPYHQALDNEEGILQKAHRNRLLNRHRAFRLLPFKSINPKAFAQFLHVN